MDLYRFDEAYLTRLRSADPETENHFSSYFGRMLTLKLRNRLRGSASVEDLKQETLFRVLKNIRSDSGLREPEKFGSFVNSTCNFVLLEFYRSGKRESPLEQDKFDPADAHVDLEKSAATAETKERVHAALGKLDKKDGDLLRALFIDERDKDEICGKFGVDRDYLRVLLYRAKIQFRNYYKD